MKLRYKRAETFSSLIRYKDVSAMDLINIKKWWLQAKYSSYEDCALVDLVIIESDEVAFGILYERYKLGAYNYALSILKDKARAMDATHDCFLKFYEKRSSFKEEIKFKPLFYRMIRNRCFDLLKKKSELLVEDEYELEFSERDDVVFDETLKNMSLEQIDKAFYELDDGQREVFLLWAQGFSMKEISVATDLKESDIKTKIHRAKKKLSTLGSQNEKEN
ncbi:RNA polymerase sigma factor [Halobacteriovorax sp. HLS]|uniref:RNA polymerase sigma factor n=1 Tax=Halobacteriovorax sp. HLS TaxID=2234000 RepID=UPI000FDA4531|nr:sigma-70 family RNA polymerase sigma factor [Halobacteriovorax sp. HLS]